MQEDTVIVIPMEDPIIHTDDHPYCCDLSCPCHDDGNRRLFTLMLTLVTLVVEAAVLSIGLLWLIDHDPHSVPMRGFLHGFMVTGTILLTLVVCASQVYWFRRGA